MFNIGNEITMRRLVAAPDAAWDCVAMIARQSPADDDRESLIDYRQIMDRLATTFANISKVTPEVDDSWITKSPNHRVKQQISQN